MKVGDAQMTRALDCPPADMRLFLLYGPDDAGSRALAARLERAMGPDAERIDLDGAMLKDDPARLADEAASLSLFGGRRHIRVIGGDECTAAIAALLGAQVVENPVVLIAGGLKSSSPLLKVALDHPAVLARQSYKPEGAALESLAVQLARAHGVRLQHGAAARFAAGCLGDRGVLESEIAKLSLFLDAAPDRPREGGADALDAVAADLDEPDTSALVDAALSGRLDMLAHEIDAIEDWIPALRAVQRRIALLARLRADVDSGTSIGAVMTATGKALFWKDKDKVAAQLGLWSAARLATAHARIFAAEGAMITSGSAGAVLAAQELIAIGRAAQRRR